MVHGRDGELRRIDELLDGGGGALLLLGEAGIGKTALLRAAAERAATRGMAVVSAHAVEAERDLPRAALAALPGPADAPLEERLAAAASERPLLVTLDDAQWLDDASLQELTGAVRRLGGARVALLLAGRAEPPRGLAARGVAVLDLGGLDDAAARRLLGDALAPEPRGHVLDDAAARRLLGDGLAPERRRHGLDDAAARRLAPEPCRHVLDAARGNPLALLELAAALTPPERAGAVAVTVPLRAGDAVRRLFERELAALPVPARQALLVLAAEEELTHDRLGAVLAALRHDRSAIASALGHGVIAEAGGRLRVRHPLLRSVAYHHTPAADRAAVHAALAAQLAASGDDLGRWAWHLAASATRPDAALATTLETAAEDAWGDGALVAAADTFAHAAALTPAACAEDRARRTLSAARLLAVAGQPRRALALAEREQAATPACGPALRAALQHVRGTVTMRAGDLDGGAQILIGEAERVADADPARAAAMLLDASHRSRVLGDYAAMVRLTRRTRCLAARTDPPLAALGEVVEALALLQRGDGAAAEAVLACHEELLLDPLASRFGMELLGAAAQASTWLGRFDRAERLLGTLVARARRQAATTALVYPLAARAQLHLRRGRLRPALADGREAVRLAAETGQDGLVAFATAMLCEAEALLGHEDACRTHAATSIAICDAAGGDAGGLWARSALGQLELTLGRPEAAVAHLEACAELADRVGLVEPSTVQWAPNLIEALARSGRAHDAHAHLVRLQAGCGTAWARGALERSQAVLAEGPEGERALEAAIVAFDHAGARFEAARSRLALGERRRRAKQRRASRTPLTAALGAFDAAGAEPWAARAREELRAGGLGTAPAAPVPAAWDELTPHELRVARLVAGGRTNREVATELYVTHKTIEHHLSQVYRKLGIRSRTDLTRLLASES
jgi:DNA-binding CsgD family transcriptional regulator